MSITIDTSEATKALETLKRLAEETLAACQAAHEAAERLREVTAPGGVLVPADIDEEMVRLLRDKGTALVWPRHAIHVGPPAPVAIRER